MSADGSHWYDDCIGVSVVQQFVHVNGISLNVAQCGAQDEGRPLVLLLHGFPEFWGSWRNQISALVGMGYRVWVPDLRGYNTSDAPQKVSEYRMSNIGTDVRELIRVANADSCVLVGHDWGAAIAWWVAAEYPEHVDKLIIANVPHPRVFRRHVFTSPRQMCRSWYVFFFQLPWLPEWLLSRKNFSLLGLGVFDTALEETFSEEHREVYKSAWTRSGLRPMINYYRAAMRYQELPKPGLIEVPTLIIWGRRDHVLGLEMAGESIDLCRNGRLVVIDEATHWVHLDAPNRFNAEMTAHLRDLSST